MGLTAWHHALLTGLSLCRLGVMPRGWAEAISVLPCLLCGCRRVRSGCPGGVQQPMADEVGRVFAGDACHSECT